MYGLYVVIVHIGRTLHGGHYIAYVKMCQPAKEKKSGSLKNEKASQKHKYDTDYCKKGHWYYTSDTHVRQCSFEDVKRSKAYLLFYKRLPLTK